MLYLHRLLVLLLVFLISLNQLNDYCVLCVFLSSKSLRYFGPIPLYAFQARTIILKSILALIGSLWRYFLAAVILILSYFFDCINTLAHEFWTICNFLCFVYGKQYNKELLKNILSANSFYQSAIHMKGWERKWPDLMSNAKYEDILHPHASKE